MEKIDFRAVKRCRPSIVTEEDSGCQDTTCKRLCLSLKKKPNRFATVSNEEVKAAANGVVPENTKCSNDWAVRNLGAWISDHNKRSGDGVPINLLECNDPAVLCK